LGTVAIVIVELLLIATAGHCPEDLGDQGRAGLDAGVPP